MATILIVDDRPANREYLVALLGYGGHRLLQAADGEEGLAMALAERPDLVIADILMPTMDGYELVRRLRAVPLIAHTPVIFWTAHFHEREARALAESCGVSSVITKPSEPEIVLRAVEAALGLGMAATPSVAEEDFDREHLRLLTDKLSQKADDLRTTNARLSALVELNLQLGSELDPRRLIQGLTDAAREIIGARYAITGLLDESGTGFQSVFTSGMDAAMSADLITPDPRSAALATVLREAQAFRGSNPAGNPVALGLPAAHPPVHAWLAIPITSPKRVYGYVSLIDRMGLSEFSAEDEKLAQTLGAQVGRIYENGSLYSAALTHAANLEREISARVETEKALAERVRQGLLIGEVGAAITRSESLEEMLDLCAQALPRNLDAALARIWTYNEADELLELKASAGVDTDLTGPYARVPLGQFRVGAIAQGREPYFTNSLLTDPMVHDREFVTREGLTAFVGNPLMVEGRLLGVVAIFARSPLTAASVASLETVANELSLGIHHFRANDALRERQERIRLLLDSTAEAILGSDLDSICTFANAACARVLGYDHPSQLVGRNLHALMHHSRPDGTPYPEEECNLRESFVRGEGSHRINEVFWRADGTSFPAECWSYPIRSEERIVGSVVTFLDITERRKLESQFQSAERRLRHVVASSPAVLFTLSVTEEDIDGISWTSGNILEIMGVPTEAALGREWWMTGIHPEDRDRVMAEVRSDLFSRGHNTSEYQFRHANGHYIWTQCEIRMMRDESGHPVEAVGAWSDITKRKLAELEQDKLREQLQQAQKLESIGRLAGGVAHDFNNLLTVINGYSDLLIHKLHPEDPIREDITEIRTAGERAAALSAQLLVLSRKQVVQAAEVNLNDIIVEVERMLGRVLGAEIRLESDLSPDLGLVMADSGQIHQILMNLAVNARDAMIGGGILLIETANIDLAEGFAERHVDVQPGRYVQLTVSDTGTGMTPEVLAHLFEPFFTTKKVGEGTGLGLATVYGIIKQSGGSIWPYSEPGQGTSFKIYLPRIESSGMAQDQPKGMGPMLSGTETILVVEDQEQLRKMATRVLRNQGYTVYDAPNPREALDLCERYTGPIDLLLTDVSMPGMSGPKLANCLKPTRPSMRVLFMSGYSERAIIDRLSLAGGYLAKPFSPEALATKVRAALSAPPSGLTILVVDDEPGIRSLLKKILTQENHQVLEAENGAMALREVAAHHVDLMITDLVMPEQEGLETIRELRTRQPNLKIIAMSGQFGGAMLHLSELLGANASLAKPIEPHALLETIARVMDAKGKTEEGGLRQ